MRVRTIVAFVFAGTLLAAVARLGRPTLLGAEDAPAAFLPVLALDVEMPAGMTTLVSVASDGTRGDDASGEPSISADGRFVAFTSRSANLSDADVDYMEDVFVHDRETGETALVSVEANGIAGNGPSSEPAISGDGRYVAFTSTANNLVGEDSNNYCGLGTDNCPDVFVHDRDTGVTTRVSVANDGTEANSFSGAPAISGDGRYVAFVSNADNLVAGDTNLVEDVFVHDRAMGVSTRVSVASSGAESFGGSVSPSISADGRFVVFASWAATLVEGDTNGTGDIFVHELATGQTARVSVASDGTEADNVSWGRPSISGDGRFITFMSFASNLVPGDTNVSCYSRFGTEAYNCPDVFVRDRQTGETTLVSISSSGRQANSISSVAAISPDGRYVAFFSYASNLVFGDNNGGTGDIFVRDRLAQTTELASLADDETSANSGSFQPAISAGGHYVAFGSEASNLVVGDMNLWSDVFVRDRGLD